MPRYIAFAFALLAVMSLAYATGCKDKGNDTGGGGDGKGGGEIKIGVFLELSGGVAEFGKATNRGIELATEEINADKGISGNKIVLKTYDIKSDSSESTTVAKKLATDDKVNVAIGCVASSYSKAAAPTFQQNGIPMVTPSSTNPTVTEIGDHIFRVCFIDDFQGAACAEFAIKDMGSKVAAIALEKGSAYSQGLGKFFRARFEKLGGKVSLEVEFPGGEKDYSTVVSNIVKAEPKVDTVFMPFYYEEAAAMARELRKQGFEGKMIGGDGWESPTLVPLSDGKLEGCYFGNHYNPKDSNPKTKAFVEAYTKKYGHEPNSLAALGYDAVYAVKQAAESKGGISREQITQGLAALKDFKGVTGTFELDAKRNPRKPIVMLRIVGNNFEQVRQIKPGDVE
ncbi:MAG: ABC transporter substrate-binding protein [Planctomycetes bacterium]|nr:ABC transporter substrate-binding protein [Planctomycetota bacterium]